MLTIEQKKMGEITVLELAGDFFGTPEQREMFDAELTRILTDGCRKVILDIANTRLISSGGIGMIVAAHNKLGKKNGIVAIARPSDAMKPLLDVFDWPVMCFSTQEEAVDYLNVATPG